jgi:uncharacterized membrane protein
MSESSATLLTIIGMATATYATRLGGLWLAGFFPESRRLERCLQHIPGAVIISLIAPHAFLGGPANALAAAVTGLVAARTRNVLLAMIAGVATAWLARRVLA